MHEQSDYTQASNNAFIIQLGILNGFELISTKLLLSFTVSSLLPSKLSTGSSSGTEQQIHAYMGYFHPYIMPGILAVGKNVRLLISDVHALSALKIGTAN